MPQAACSGGGELVWSAVFTNVLGHLLTFVRLLLVLPAALAFGRPESSWAHWIIPILAVAIASDFADGMAARRFGTASPAGRMFDHTSDCLFVTASLTGSAISKATTPLLPALVALAFAQYVLDSRFLHRSPVLRMSWLGRRNGIFYFVPLALVAIARSPLSRHRGTYILEAACVLSYVLVASTLLSMLDRAVASQRTRA